MRCPSDFKSFEILNQGSVLLPSSPHGAMPLQPQRSLRRMLPLTVGPLQERGTVWDLTQGVHVSPGVANRGGSQTLDRSFSVVPAWSVCWSLGLGQ